MVQLGGLTGGQCTCKTYCTTIRDSPERRALFDNRVPADVEIRVPTLGSEKRWPVGGGDRPSSNGPPLTLVKDTTYRIHSKGAVTYGREDSIRKGPGGCR